MILTLFGAAGLVNGVPNSKFVLFAGLIVLVYMFFGWFGQVATESDTFGALGVDHHNIYVGNGRFAGLTKTKEQ